MAAIGQIRRNVGCLVFVIAFAIMGFLLMDVMSGPGSMGGAEIPTVGSVNGVDVNYNDYQRKVQSALTNLQRSGQEVSEQQRLQMRESTWDQYVKDLLADNEMEELGINVSLEELKALVTSENAHPAIKNDPTFMDPNTGAFDPARVRQYISQTLSNSELPENQTAQARSTWNTFEQYLRRDAQKTKYLDLVKKSIYVPNWMGESINTDQNNKIDLSYVLVPYNKVPDSDVPLTNQDLKSYLNDNKAIYEQEASRDIEYVTFAVRPSAKDTADVISSMHQLGKDWASSASDSLFMRLNSETPYTGAYLSEAELGAEVGTDRSLGLVNSTAGFMEGPFLYNGFYKMIKVVDTRMVADSVECRHILKSIPQGGSEVAARKTLDSLMALLNNGVDFTVLAANNSDDQGSAESGGELGFAKKGQMVKPFNDAIFYQMETGDRKIVRSQFGLHLIEVVQSNPTNQAAKVAILSRELAPSSNTSRSTFAQANSFASLYRNTDSFRKGAQDEGLELKTASKLKSNDYNIPGLGFTDQICSWAHMKSVGDVSNVITVGDNYVVGLITAERDAGMPSIDDIKPLLESEVKKIKKAEKLIAQMGGLGTDIDAIANTMEVSTQNISDLSFANNSGTNLASEPEVVATAHSLSQGEVSKPIKGNLGVYQVRVDAVNAAAAPADYSALTGLELSSKRNSVDFKVWEALKNAANVEDMRFKNRGVQ